MHRLAAFLLGWITAATCIAQEIGMPASDPSKCEAAAQPAVSDKAEQHALRVRGMKAAVADIENNQLWILNEVRAQRCARSTLFAAIDACTRIAHVNR